MQLDFDEIFVISDLHLGGVPGHRIFANQPELLLLLDHVRQRPGKLRVGLVINGDLVDFLAEPKARYLDPEGATERLDRIRNDATFRPIFDSFAALVQTPNRFLAITLGNHDLELALPHVRLHLTQLLCGDREDAHARLPPSSTTSCASGLGSNGTKSKGRCICWGRRTSQRQVRAPEPRRLSLPRSWCGSSTRSTNGGRWPSTW